MKVVRLVHILVICRGAHRSYEYPGSVQAENFKELHFPNEINALAHQKSF